MVPIPHLLLCIQPLLGANPSETGADLIGQLTAQLTAHLTAQFASFQQRNEEFITLRTTAASQESKKDAEDIKARICGLVQDIQNLRQAIFDQFRLSGAFVNQTAPLGAQPNNPAGGIPNPAFSIPNPVFGAPPAQPGFMNQQSSIFRTNLFMVPAIPCGNCHCCNQGLPCNFSLLVSIIQGIHNNEPFAHLSDASKINPGDFTLLKHIHDKFSTPLCNASSTCKECNQRRNNQSLKNFLNNLDILMYTGNYGMLPAMMQPQGFMPLFPFNALQPQLRPQAPCGAAPACNKNQVQQQAPKKYCESSATAPQANTSPSSVYDNN